MIGRSDKIFLHRNIRVFNDIDSIVELTYIDIDNDQIEIMKNDDIIDSLKWCSTTKKDNNEMMSIKIFAKVLINVSSLQQNQQLRKLSY